MEQNFVDSYYAREPTVQQAVDQLVEKELIESPDIPPIMAAVNRRNGDIEFRIIDPRVLRAAMRAAEGERSRLRYNDDGSITVLNNPQW
ncbi:MAG TPA: hypothetical protein VG992_00990 [Candidatus Saccharimonadales bacterium]|nr:hypothetical protein [Candidatus Saccharimonadales bacterium]